jgi:hypothetical protein
MAISNMIAILFFKLMSETGTALLIMGLIIAIGIWTIIKGKYHIFYFSLCGILPVCIVLSIASLISKAMEGSVAIHSDGSQSEPFHFTFSNWHFTIGIFCLVSIASLNNLFIPKNKQAVKILSACMLVICGLLYWGYYKLIHIELMHQ